MSRARASLPAPPIRGLTPSLLPSEPLRRWDALAREERHLLLSCADADAEAACEQLEALAELAASRVGRQGASGAPALGLWDVSSLVLLAHCVLPDHLPW